MRVTILDKTTQIDSLQKLLSKNDLEAIRNLLKDIVNDFHPKNEILDYVYKGKAKQIIKFIFNNNLYTILQISRYQFLIQYWV